VPAGLVLSGVFGKRPTSEADATVVAVKMTERRSYGEAKVRVTYAVEAVGWPPFEAVREAAVRMSLSHKRTARGGGEARPSLPVRWRLEAGEHLA
jgi:hypothetical protein